MLKDIHIQNYRGIKDLKIKDFKRINILVGDNNSGKTSVLEAILLLLVPKNPLLLLDLMLKKDVSIQMPNAGIQLNIADEESWRKLSYSFFRANSGNQIEIASGLKKIPSEPSDYLLKVVQNSQINHEIFGNKTNISTLPRNIFFEYRDKAGNIAKTGFSNDGNFKIEPNSSADISGLGSLIHPGPKLSSSIYPLLNSCCTTLERKKEIRNILKIVEPLLEDFEINPEISSYFKNGLKLPINYMGDGIRYLLHYLVSIYCSSKGVVLIDEIESGLHWKTQRILWKAVIKAAEENNVQIIATTHSREMISALSDVYEESGKDDFAVFSLDKEGDKNYVNTYAGEDLKFMLNAGGEFR